jgi:uncharacterized protein YegP (UPF0339 family)
MAAKFTVYLDKSKKFRFNLKASNGQIIASSEAYETKVSCMNGIKSIQKNSPDALVIDETLEKKAPAKRGAEPAKRTRTARGASETPVVKRTRKPRTPKSED